MSGLAGQQNNLVVLTGQAPERVVVARLLEQQRPGARRRHRENKSRRDTRVDQVLFDVNEEKRRHVPQHERPEERPLLRRRQVDVVQRLRGGISDVRLILIEHDLGRFSVIRTEAGVFN